MPLDLTDDNSTLVQVMAWCRQATSHYLSQCWPRSMSPNGVTRPQWVNLQMIWIWLLTLTMGRINDLTLGRLVAPLWPLQETKISIEPGRLMFLIFLGQYFHILKGEKVHLIPKRLGYFLKNVVLFRNVVPYCVIFLYETDPIQWMFSQHCGYWWPGALAPGHQ